MKNEKVIKSETINGHKITLTKNAKNKEYFRYMEINGETFEMGFDNKKDAEKRYSFDLAGLGLVAA